MNALEWTLFGVVGAAAAALGVLIWRRRKRRSVEVQVDEARRSFQLRREWFEARFLTLASQSGKPRGLVWVDCDFQREVTFARQRESRKLQAFVGVLVRFRAVEGGDMEDNPNVKNLRDATAVFSFENGQWDTEGRVVFNLSPSQTIQKFQHELELVE